MVPKWTKTNDNGLKANHRVEQEVVRKRIAEDQEIEERHGRKRA